MHPIGFGGTTWVLFDAKRDAAGRYPYFERLKKLIDEAIASDRRNPGAEYPFDVRGNQGLMEIRTGYRYDDDAGLLPPLEATNADAFLRREIPNQAGMRIISADEYRRLDQRR